MGIYLVVLACLFSLAYSQSYNESQDTAGRLLDDIACDLETINPSDSLYNRHKFGTAQGRNLYSPGSMDVKIIDQFIHVYKVRYQHVAAYCSMYKARDLNIGRYYINDAGNNGFPGESDLRGANDEFDLNFYILSTRRSHTLTYRIQVYGSWVKGSKRTPPKFQCFRVNGFEKGDTIGACSYCDFPKTGYGLTSNNGDGLSAELINLCK